MDALHVKLAILHALSQKLAELGLSLALSGGGEGLGERGGGVDCDSFTAGGGGGPEASQE